MIVADVTSPRLQIVDSGTTARLHLGAGNSLLLSTVAEARALISELAKALVYLDSDECRAAQTRQDKAAAVAMNLSNEKAHRRWGSRLSAPHHTGEAS